MVVPMVEHLVVLMADERAAMRAGRKAGKMDSSRVVYWADKKVDGRAGWSD